MHNSNVKVEVIRTQCLMIRILEQILDSIVCILISCNSFRIQLCVIYSIYLENALEIPDFFTKKCLNTTYHSNFIRIGAHCQI